MRRTTSARLGIAAVLIALGAACSETTAPETPPDRQAAAVPDPGHGLSIYGLGTLNAAVPSPCRAAGTRDFDFWLGSWNVERDGSKIGTSVITSELDGCVVVEDFINNGGVRARSLSAYDAATGRWHQAYQDNVLGNYRLHGVGGQGTMELSGTQRIYHFGLQDFVERHATSTWTDRGDGTVRQTIRGTFDGGPEQVLFDGLYLPDPDPDRATPAYFRLCREVLPGFRELDFWLGSWTVRATPGDETGRSEVAARLNGCLLRHDFRGRNGYRSRSFLFWDFAEGRWFRTLADNTGTFVQLSGELSGQAMVLTGVDQTQDGGEVRVRNTLRRDGDDVLETWEVSRDDGAGWRTALTLRYEGR